MMKDDPAASWRAEVVVRGWWCKMDRDLGSPARSGQLR